MKGKVNIWWWLVQGWMREIVLSKHRTHKSCETRPVAQMTGVAISCRSCLKRSLVYTQASSSSLFSYIHVSFCFLLFVISHYTTSSMLVNWTLFLQLYQSLHRFNYPSCISFSFFDLVLHLGKACPLHTLLSLHCLPLFSLQLGRHKLNPRQQTVFHSLHPKHVQHSASTMSI